MKSPLPTNTKKKENAREFCKWCEYKKSFSNKWFFEYNPDWHGMKVYQRVCVKCGFAVVLYEHNEISLQSEEEALLEELKHA